MQFNLFLVIRNILSQPSLSQPSDEIPEAETWSRESVRESARAYLAAVNDTFEVRRRLQISNYMRNLLGWLKL